MKKFIIASTAAVLVTVSVGAANAMPNAPMHQNHKPFVIQKVKPAPVQRHAGRQINHHPKSNFARNGRYGHHSRHAYNYNQPRYVYNNCHSGCRNNHHNHPISNDFATFLTVGLLAGGVAYALAN